MREYLIKLIGMMPILFHKRDLEQEAEMKVFREQNKSISVPGDDRSPVWRWMGSLHFDDNGNIAIPQAALMAALRTGGSQIPRTGSGYKNYSRPSQFGIGVLQDYLEFRCNGKQLNMGPLLELKARDYLLPSSEYEKHKAAAAELGFTLHRSAVRVKTSQHIRIRPIFDNWTVEATIRVLESEITDDLLRTIFEKGGVYGGLLDYAPHCQKAGPHGTFRTEFKPVGPSKRKSA